MSPRRSRARRRPRRGPTSARRARPTPAAARREPAPPTRVGEDLAHPPAVLGQPLVRARRSHSLSSPCPHPPGFRLCSAAGAHASRTITDRGGTMRATVAVPASRWPWSHAATPTGHRRSRSAAAKPVELDPADFTAGSDHPYFPLEPGTQWRYRETDTEGSVAGRRGHGTSETRTLANGVEARVVRDTVTEGGLLVEDTFDWYAQDARRQRLVPRRGDRGVRGRPPGVARGFVRGRRRRGAAGGGHARGPGGRAGVPAGVLRRRGRGQRRRARHRTAGRGAARATSTSLLTADTNALEPEVLEYKLTRPTSAWS